ncbi:hypothetical protein BHE74_00052801 [Ensete ventricosum]|nr:hypothetical protein BHE74_00052801 [Ensete ventricosum]
MEGSASHPEDPACQHKWVKMTSGRHKSQRDESGSRQRSKEKGPVRSGGRACHSRVREGDFAFPTGLPALHLAVRGFNRQSIKGVGLGRKIEDELLKSAWEIEALWAEPPQTVIADYKEKPEFKLELKRSGKCHTNMGIAWP